MARGNVGLTYRPSSDKFITATAGSNGDFYITLLGTLATNDIVYISFPSATNGASNARLSVDGGTTYKNIKLYSILLASGVASKKLSFVYDGTDFVPLNPITSYARLIGTIAAFQALTQSAVTFIKWGTSSVVGVGLSATPSTGVIAFSYDGSAEISANMMLYGCTIGDAIMVELMYDGTVLYTYYYNIQTAGYDIITIPPMIIPVANGKSVSLAVRNASAARGNAGNNNAYNNFGCMLNVERK